MGQINTRFLLYKDLGIKDHIVLNLPKNLSAHQPKNLILLHNLLSFLQYADGKNDLKKISELIKISYKKTFKVHNILIKYKLIT